MNEPLNSAPNDRLLKIMEARELREAKIFERQEQERAAKEANYEVHRQKQIDADKAVFTSLFLVQSRCDHRKGTSGKRKWRHIDNMMDRHTLPNGLMRIKCQKCRMTWFPGDTPEKCSYTLDNWLNKKTQPNPTKISYAKAYDMTSDEWTTNTETRSEMVTQGPQPVTA